MERSGGEIAGKRAKPDAAAGEDRLSALPDDVLLLILRLLRTTAAAQTSVLSRRWRRVWARLPGLRFPSPSEPHHIASALAAHEGPLGYLHVGALDAAPESVAAWLPVAARRLSGRLIFVNRVPGKNATDGGEEAAAERGAFQLPCLENATTIFLVLGFLGLAVPPAGVFARLTELSLNRVWFHGPSELGDAVSSQRCPTLKKLSICHARGLGNLAIHSESLLEVALLYLDGLQQLTVVAQALKELKLYSCFDHSRPVVNISTPQLAFLLWKDPYDPSTVHLGNLGQVQSLITDMLHVYGQHDCSIRNHGLLRLLQRFQVIHSLMITLAYHQDIGDLQYLMEDIAMLPHVTVLTLMVISEGHIWSQLISCAQAVYWYKEIVAGATYQ